MLLGTPQTKAKERVFVLSATARASDHFGELEGTGATSERVQRTMEALTEKGYLALIERTNRAKEITYSTVAITQMGRDALVGGVELPAFPDVEVSA